MSDYDKKDDNYDDEGDHQDNENNEEGEEGEGEGEEGNDNYENDENKAPLSKQPTIGSQSNSQIKSNTQNIEKTVKIDTSNLEKASKSTTQNLNKSNQGSYKVDSTSGKNTGNLSNKSGKNTENLSSKQSTQKVDNQSKPTTQNLESKNKTKELSKRREREVIDRVIYCEDGHRETENKHLRLVRLPKIDFSATQKKKETIDDDLEEQMRNVFEMYCEDGHADPVEILKGLKWVNLHVNYPDIMRLVEDFVRLCELEKKKTVTFPKFMNYINERMSDYSTWNTCGKVFENIKDRNLSKKNIHEISSESLMKMMEEINVNDLTLDDINYIMNLASDGKDPNITQDEFYYLMTKQPIQYDALANITKSFKPVAEG